MYFSKLFKARILGLFCVYLLTAHFADSKDLLFEAIINGDVKKVKQALKGKASVQSRLHGSSPLHLAAYYGRLEIAKLLLSKGADINDRDLGKENPDWRPIHYAIMNKKSKTAIFLMKMGADLNAQSKDGLTPLHFSSATELMDVTEELIKRRANLNLKTNRGLTPLDLARTTKIK
ncbi:MAG: ankyrin repeat domain-containing protein, partial [Spirochaetota bacterium]|nr:ankyrin repeat domain-containing protein [Spirochaetota bacterium]